MNRCKTTDFPPALLSSGAWWMMAVGVGAPFWQPFMIQILGMGLVEMLLYGAREHCRCSPDPEVLGQTDRPLRQQDRDETGHHRRDASSRWSGCSSQETRWLLVFEAAASGSMWGCVGVVTARLVLAVAPEKAGSRHTAVFTVRSAVLR
ncbi:MAG: hypothetical protein MZV70_05715 [Desulfobacterales bacterium]|nr:hypothetical protein [Desulfobacterales bacterium]